MLADLDFDVILSNSFACTPSAWVEVNSKSRKKIFADLISDLKAS